jgi:hypothetical protein
MEEYLAQYHGFHDSIKNCSYSLHAKAKDENSDWSEEDH